MTKKLRFTAAGVAMFAAIGMTSAASAQDSATATATVEVLEALSLTNNNALDFGTIVVDNAGTVTIAASDTASAVCTGDVICSGTSSAASFTVDGSDGQVVEINLPAASGTLLRSGGTPGVLADEIVLDNFTASGSTVTLAGGTADFEVGAEIALDGSEVEGVYSTTFDVSVDYQ